MVLKVITRGLMAAVLLFIAIPVELAEATITDITSLGTPSASSVFPGYFVSSGVDGSATTDWYSDGCAGGAGSGGANTESYYWELSQDRQVTRVELDPETLDGFGFEKIRFRLFNSLSAMTYESSEIALAAFDVNIAHDLPSAAIGNKLEILLINHENCACGGFRELRVFGSATPLPATGGLGLAAMALVMAGALIWWTWLRPETRTLARHAGYLDIHGAAATASARMASVRSMLFKTNRVSD